VGAYGGGSQRAPVPYADLDRIWKTVLLHQFHDILPGSSIAWVHRESRATYDVSRRTGAIIGAAQRRTGRGPRGRHLGSGTVVIFRRRPHARAGVPGAGGGPGARPAAGVPDGEDGGYVPGQRLVRAV